MDGAAFLRAHNEKVNKVDASRLALPKRSWSPDFNEHPPGRAPYRREPYVRATLDDGSTIDAKAIGWTDIHVHLKWQDEDFEIQTRWVMATAVRRITREESSWRDPYDIID